MPRVYYKLSGEPSSMRYTAKEVAKILKLTPQYIRRLAKKHNQLMFNHEYLFSNSDLEQIKTRNTHRGRIALDK
jgi:hypothetical protein